MSLCDWCREARIKESFFRMYTRLYRRTWVSTGEHAGWRGQAQGLERGNTPKSAGKAGSAGRNARFIAKKGADSVRKAGRTAFLAYTTREIGGMAMTGGQNATIRAKIWHNRWDMYRNQQKLCISARICIENRENYAYGRGNG